MCWSLGQLRSRARWADISQGEDQITPLLSAGSSQLLLSRLKQCWLSLVNYRGRWDLLRQSNYHFFSLNEEDDGKKFLMNGGLGHWNFPLFSSKTIWKAWPWFTLKVFLFPSVLKKKGSQALLLTGQGSNSLSFEKALWALISDPFSLVHVLRGKGRNSCNGKEKAHIHFNRAGTVLLKGKPQNR